MAGWFASQPEVQEMAASCLRIIATGYVFYAWQMVLVAAFAEASDTRTSALVNIICFWFVKLPLAYFLVVTLDLAQNGVFYVVTGAYCLATVVAFVLFRRGSWKTRELSLS